VSQPPRLADYCNDIERFFALVRMSGFVLSARDAERVRQWYLAGIPLAVVVEGIVAGARSWRYKAGTGERPPHNLSFYSRFVGTRVRAFRRQGEPAEVAEEVPASSGLGPLLSEVELLALREERPLERAVKEELLAGLRELSATATTDDGELASALQLLDARILALYHGRLEPEAQAEVADEVGRALAGEPGLSRRAREGRERALLGAALRRRLKLVELVELVA